MLAGSAGARRRSFSQRFPRAPRLSIEPTMDDGFTDGLDEREAGAPTPGISYQPFAPPGSPAAAPYVDFGQYDSFVSVTSDDGIFLSAAEVFALKKYAEDREVMQARLTRMEEEAAAREQEVTALRAKLEDEAKPAASGSENMRRRLPLKPVSASASSKLSDRDLNVMATQRQNESVAKREAQNAKLREQWRQLRSTRDAIDANNGTTTAVSPVAAVMCD